MTAEAGAWHHNCHTTYASVGEVQLHIHNRHGGGVEIAAGHIVQRSAAERSGHIETDVDHVVRGDGTELSKAGLWKELWLSLLVYRSVVGG